jgi:hypothetical protein
MPPGSMFRRRVSNLRLMRFSLSEKLLLVAAALSVTHHVDHVLRADHSGWPFRQEVTPFSFSLLVYPLFLSVLLLITVFN